VRSDPSMHAHTRYFSCAKASAVVTCAAEAEILVKWLYSDGPPTVFYDIDIVLEMPQEHLSHHDLVLL
jgi:hypothetical protein